jgi:prepilin-type processing-associated H-X9-DG protein
LAKAREAARTVQCASNVRQLGLGYENYNKDFRCMPSVHRNTWWLTAPYLSAAQGYQMEPTDDANVKYPEYYKCPTDSLRPSKPGGCSYGLNFAQIDPFAWATSPPDLAYILENGGVGNVDYKNQIFSPFSNYKLDASGQLAQDAYYLGTKDLAKCAPNTVMLIVVWDPYNQVRFCQGGTVAVSTSDPTPLPATPAPGLSPFWVAAGYQVSPMAALFDWCNYEWPVGPGLIAADGTWVLAWDQPYAGSRTSTNRQSKMYNSLFGFESRIVNLRRNAVVDEACYHGGRVNVLFCDQHVETMECSQMFSKRIMWYEHSGTSYCWPIIYSPIWTRGED